MTPITTKQIDIVVHDCHVSGVLSVLHASGALWDFKSTHPRFVELFPSGILYSFSSYGGEDSIYYLYQKAIREKISELVERS